MILLIIFIVFTMFLLYAWACIIVRVNQYCSTLTSVFNMYFSYLIHYLSIATSLRCSAQLRTVSSSSGYGPCPQVLNKNTLTSSQCEYRAHSVLTQELRLVRLSEICAGA